MNTQEILSIIALSLLGLCFLSGLVKMTMKNESHKKPYEQGCAASVFIAVVLLGISQLLTEEKYDDQEGCNVVNCDNKAARLHLQCNCSPAGCVNEVGDMCGSV
jgi:hypothetical protein